MIESQHWTCVRKPIEVYTKYSRSDRGYPICFLRTEKNYRENDQEGFVNY